MKNFLTILMIPSLGFAAPVTTTEELVKAVSKASGETTIELSAGTFDVPSQLLIKTGTTLTGPNLHGAIFGWGNQKIHLHHLKIEDFMYSGFRSYDTRELKVHDCLFIDAGQRWE